MMWLCHLVTRIVMMHSRWLTCVRMVELLVVRSVLTLEIGASVLRFACERGHRSFGEVAQDLVLSMLACIARLLSSYFFMKVSRVRRIPSTSTAVAN